MIWARGTVGGTSVRFFVQAINQGDLSHGWSWHDCYNFVWYSDQLETALRALLTTATPGLQNVTLTPEAAVMLDGGGSTQFYWRRILRSGPPVLRQWPDSGDAVPDYVQSGAPNSNAWPPEP
ncbi:MAG: hypothetical protein V1912_00025 [bacterium]